MPAPKLYVVFYRPRYGNYQHWALHLELDNEDYIFEVTGSHPNFKRNVVNDGPERSASFHSRLFLGEIQPGEVAMVQHIAAATKVDNDTVHWDCQDYVMDILEELENECIVDEDDDDYKKAKRTLIKRRGPVT